MYFKAPRFAISLLLIICLFLGCNKNYIPVPDPMQQNVINLTGVNGAYSAWRLDSLVVGDRVQPMLPPYSDYHISYHLNGSFQDSDGMKGTWTMVSKDSFCQKITNVTTGVYALQGYHINQLSAAEMQLKYAAGGKSVVASYTAEK